MKSAILFDHVVVNGMLIIWLFFVGFNIGLNVEDLKQRTYKFFGPGSEYDTPVNDPYRDKGGQLIYCTRTFSYLFTLFIIS